MSEEIPVSDLGIEDEDQDAVDVMKGYVEEENSSASESYDIFDERSNSNDATEKRSRRKFVLADHIKVIADQPPTHYHCTICDSYFSHINTARNHEFCGSGQQKPYKCNLCDKRFVNKCDRDNHYRIHSGERPYECSICSKTFQLKHKLSRHIRSHTGIKGDLKCVKCQRTFICKEALRKHEVTKHTSKKSTDCKACKKLFKNSVLLLKHKCPKRNNKKKLVCEICGKTFTTNWNLTVHQRIHKGQRPYSCTVCKKRFRLRQHAERHIAKHQPVADFECTLCNQTFGRKDNMVRHLKLTHADSNFGVHIDEIVKQAEKVKKDKTKKPSEDSATTNPTPSLQPTIIPVENLPNIRFAKMPDICGDKASSAVDKAEVSSGPSTEPGISKTDEFTSSYRKSKVTTTVIKSGNQCIVRTTKVVEQSSVIRFPVSAKSSDVQAQPSCSTDDVRRKECPVIHSIVSNQDANNSREVPEQKRFLPVSVLCFQNSSELRTARPKTSAPSYASNS